MNYQDVLIVAIHHRRSMFFEETMQLVKKAGYKNILIIETGLNAWGPYQGPYSYLLDIERSTSYDEGMVALKMFFENFNSEQVPGVFILDNDLFMTGTSLMSYIIQEAIDEDYDIVGPLISNELQKTYSNSGNLISHVPTEKIIVQINEETGIPALTPHWHTVSSFISTRALLRLSKETISHHRKLLASLYKDSKFGACNVVHSSSVTLVQHESFHVGNLMLYHYHLENGAIDKFNPKSLHDMARLGYFFEQENKFFPRKKDGSLSLESFYPKKVKESLALLENYRQEALQAWHSFTLNTCMQGWPIKLKKENDLE